ncbi:MAG: hypothetical protein HC836_31850 [Richelia sp. RM2_1_2]|nr:hypothetical protein [Richelia sp. RM2_1_2]
MPLKTEAIKRAEIEANKIINRVIKDFEEADWDLDVAAPRGDSIRDGRDQYLKKQSKHNLYKSVTTYVKPTRTRGEPNLRKQSVTHEDEFIKNAEQDAAMQYDIFVAKLTNKIGPVVSADLKGSHVWGFSILTVVKPDGTKERWKTQQIVNVSKLGKLFNQWPTRKVVR